MMYTNLKKEYDEKINNIRQILNQKIQELQNEFDFAVSVLQANCADHVFVYSSEEFERLVMESQFGDYDAFMSCKFCGKSKTVAEDTRDYD